ncbi:MAG: 50S ribosome-binding GTPase, partial [Phycisphaerales bacterium]|nr:50S ribosome-binding GTPase [Phycisphaerales bacterium]
VGTVAAAVRAELGSRAGSELSTARPVVVLAGAPNAGKSTLFNTLLGRRRAVVSSIAGTTRDVLREELDLSVLVPGAPRVILTDPAGLDKTLSLSSVLDEQSQAAARRAIAEADVVVHCDPNGTFPPLPARAGATVIRVRTKSDLVRSPCDRSPIADLDVCALDGWNLGALTGAIADAASGLYDRGRGADTTGAPASRLLPRHRRALAAALVPLDQTARLTHAGSAFASAELIAGSLRAALDALAELTGRVSPDDIVGRIFATFCIGK